MSRSDALKDEAVDVAEAAQPTSDDRGQDNHVTTELHPASALVEEPSEEPRQLKRKRRERSPGPVRMTRSMSGRGENAGSTIAVKSPPKRRRAEGKQKALELTTEEEEQAVAEERTSPAATTSEFQDGPSDEREPSRESSVLSSVLEYGEASSSPLTLSPVAEVQEVERAPPLLTNGTLQHIHGRSMPDVAQLQRRPEPVAPPPPIVFAEPAIPTPPEPVAPPPLEPAAPPPPEVAATSSAEPPSIPTPAPSPPVETEAVEPTATSPVTRSNCRFHKISLPAYEGGPRIFFAVPGCSLSDTDLMAKEHIEDHGDAIVDDVKHLIRDIKTLEVYNSYLEGVLRQLLGVDLLREQEIYYMVQPGEVPRYKPIKTSAYRPRESFSGQPSSQRSPRISHRTKALKRTSTPSESISSTGSVGHRSTRRSLSISASVSDVESDGNEAQPRAKRRRAVDAMPPPMGPIADEPEPVPGPSEAVAKPRLRKSKRLPTDAAAYKPDGSEKSDSDDEEVGRRRLRPRKRARGDEEEQKTAAATRVKRRKVALPTGAAHAEDEAAEDDEAT